MKIAIIGTGFVGLVSGVCLSDFGHHVVCVDRDPAKINRSETPIYEPWLEELTARNFAVSHLSFTNDIASAIKATTSARSSPT